MTDKQLTQLGKKWQKILYLRDWDIEFKFVDKLSDDEWQAQCTWTESSKTAIIELIKPDKYKWLETIKKEQNIEQSLVHELVHLHLTRWERTNKDNSIFLEQACELIARAFCEQIN